MTASNAFTDWGGGGGGYGCKGYNGFGWLGMSAMTTVALEGKTESCIFISFLSSKNLLKDDCYTYSIYLYEHDHTHNALSNLMFFASVFSQTLEVSSLKTNLMTASVHLDTLYVPVFVTSPCVRSQWRPSIMLWVTREPVFYHFNVNNLHFLLLSKLLFNVLFTSYSFTESFIFFRRMHSQ